MSHVTQTSSGVGFALRAACWALVGLLGFAPLSGRAETTTVTLHSVGTGDRWRDVAGHLYAAAFRTSFNYSASSVIVTYEAGQNFTGRFVARGLKPHFAYQLKFEGHLNPTEHPSNALLGRHGRYWQEEWDGFAWSYGGNLNNKGGMNGGEGEWPSPNDRDYEVRCDIPDEGSPTGRLYRFMAYRPFAYFITDGRGDAEFEFRVNSTYHVLWKSTQLFPGTYDGPRVTHSYAVNPAVDTAYDTPHAVTTLSVFGEWERLPMGRIALLPGDYDVDLMLTEESFHGTDGAYSGSWAAAVRGATQFRILTAPTLILLR